MANELSEQEREARERAWRKYEPRCYAHGPATAFGCGWREALAYARKEGEETEAEEAMVYRQVRGNRAPP